MTTRYSDHSCQVDSPFMDKSIFVEGKIFSLKSDTVNGKLTGATFAVKDLYDVAGYVTGAGNVRWEESHAKADKNAHVIDLLLKAGAELVGKTITDELAFSLDGENAHFGTPLNPGCKDRIPGGSSSGSASAVAADVVDFSLGTDTAGSIRVPASYCGIYGIRTTSELISTEGIHPLSQTFDVVGWFSNDISTLKRVGDVLLPAEKTPMTVKRIIIASDILGYLKQNTRERFREEINKFISDEYEVIELDVLKGTVGLWADVFKCIQWSDLNRNHGEWARNNLDSFGEEISGRIQLIDSISAEEEFSARKTRDSLMSYIDDLSGDEALILLPTVHDIAPLKGRGIEEARVFRDDVIKCNLLSSVTGVPQVSIPLIKKSGCPIGFSIVGPRNRDLSLIRFCKEKGL